MGSAAYPRSGAVIRPFSTVRASSGTVWSRASSQAVARSAPARITGASSSTGRISQTQASPWCVGKTPAKASSSTCSWMPSQSTSPT